MRSASGPATRMYVCLSGQWAAGEEFVDLLIELDWNLVQIEDTGTLPDIPPTYGGMTRCLELEYVRALYRVTRRWGVQPGGAATAMESEGVEHLRIRRDDLLRKAADSFSPFCKEHGQPGVLPVLARFCRQSPPADRAALYGIPTLTGVGNPSAARRSTTLEAWSPTL